MTAKLAAFAKKAGVRIVSCDPEWGGRFAYQTGKSTNYTMCGFKSENAAYEHWLNDQFGSSVGKLVLKLLRKHGEL